MQRPTLVPLAAALIIATAMIVGCRAEEPERYHDLVVPEERLASSEARRAGRELYLVHCALCHGQSADGHGPRRASLDPPPRDYTDPSWRRQATPVSVFVAIREGVRGTAMPGWPVLSEDQTWDLVAFILSVGEGGQPTPGSK